MLHNFSPRETIKREVMIFQHHWEIEKHDLLDQILKLPRNDIKLLWETQNHHFLAGVPWLQHHQSSQFALLPFFYQQENNRRESGERQKALSY